MPRSRKPSGPPARAAGRAGKAKEPAVSPKRVLLKRVLLDESEITEEMLETARAPPAVLRRRVGKRKAPVEDELEGYDKTLALFKL